MLRAFFAKGALLGEETGFSWFQKLPAGVKEATMEYRIKFEARDPALGFDWTLGGKLPGFAGGSAPRGCYTRTSYDKTQEGFTMRIMWQRDGGMITYPYYPESPQVPEGRTSICGGRWDWSLDAASKTWYTLRQHIILNDPGVKNGIIRNYMDGRLVQEKTDVMFRTKAHVTSIDKVYWTTYVGGSSDGFRPDRDQYIYFDDFKVWIGSGSGSGSGSGGGTATGDGANAAPKVAFVQPADGATLAAPATLKATAEASDADGSISKVELRKNGVLVGTQAVAPYNWSLADLPAGTYTLQARAYDNRGTTANTSITLTVTGGIAGAAALYTESGGPNPTFQELNLPVGVTSDGPVPGSIIDVDNALVAKGPYASNPLIQGIRIHTLTNSAVPRSDFGDFTRWYQEDGNIQVFRLFKDEVNVRNTRGNAARIEAFSNVRWQTGPWQEWTGRYTVVKPHGCAIFQAKNSIHQWGIMITMTDDGDIVLNHRRDQPDKVIATGMAGRSFDLRVADNGHEYRCWLNGKLVGQGAFARPDGENAFRWGMYMGDTPVRHEAMVFVTGARVNSGIAYLELDPGETSSLADLGRSASRFLSFEAGGMVHPLGEAVESVRIYGMDGGLIRDLRPIGNAVSWNGTNRAGKPMAPGTYLLRAGTQSLRFGLPAR